MGGIVIIGWAAIVVAGIAALCFVAYLLLIVFVVVKTGSTEGLADVAKAISAYRVPLPTRNPRAPSEPQ